MQIQLSISVLVSDRGESVSRCLNSLVPVLQNVPSELIVVYTGTSGEGLETAKKYTENIITFQWCDDFSAARNAGLNRANGEWFMYIDDDEWLEDSSEIIKFFTTKEYKNYNTANYRVRNYEDYQGESYCDTWASRLSKRSKDLQFKGLVHESMQPWKAPTKKFGFYAHHYGYATVNYGKGRRGERNIPLLEKQIAQEPQNIRHYVQLAQEYWAINDYINTERCCRDSLGLKSEARERFWKNWASVMLVNSLNMQGKRKEAYQEGEQAVKSHLLGELYEMNVCIVLMPLCVRLKKYREGTEFARRFIRHGEILKKKPSIWESQELLSFNSAYTLTGSNQVLTNALRCAAMEKDSDSFEFFLGIALKGEIIGLEDLHTIIDELQKGDSERAALILNSFGNLQSDGSYESFQKAIYYEKQGQFHMAETYYYKSAANAEAFYSYQLISMALRNAYKLPDFIEALDLENWKKCASLVAETYIIPQYFAEKEKFERLFEQYPIYMLVLWQKLSAKCLYDEKSPLELFKSILSDYCSTVITLNHYIYKDELFEGFLTRYLPKECRAALEIQEVLDELVFPVNSNVIGKLKELMREFPQLNFVIKRLIDFIDLESANIEKKAVNKEFYETSEAVKSIMKTLADKEQYLEALNIAEELGKLLPDDVEVIRYRQMLKKMLEQ